MTVRCVPADGVELMVPHDHLCRSGFGHCSNGSEHLDLLGTTVDQVSDEDRLSGGVPAHAGSVLIAKDREEFDQLVMAAVNVTDDIETRTFQIQGFRAPIRPDYSHKVTVVAG